MRLLAAAAAAAVVLLSCVGLPFELLAEPSAPIETPVPRQTRALATEAPPSATATPLATLSVTPAARFGRLQDHEAAMLPQFQADVAALSAATSYRIEAEVDFDGSSERATIDGVARIRYQHQGTEPLREIPLMLWPNDEQYRAEMSVGPAAIDGQLTRGAPELSGQAVRYQLPESVSPGDSVDLSVPFSLSAGGPIGEGAPARFGISQGVFFAPTFYPLVPPFLDGEWRVEDAPYGGDTTNSLVAAYWVRLEVPRELELAATGVEISRSETAADRLAVEYVSGPVRDFAFALGPLAREARRAGEVEIRLWYLPQHREDVDLVLDAAAFQLELLGELVGPYPYSELDIVDLPGAFGGIEYPALVTIGTLGGPWIVEPVVHEVAHQWFYGLIGDDQVNEPWMDEAFATYATALYLENANGRGRATGYLSDHRAVVREHPQGSRPIGEPVASYPGGQYRVLVYLKGALFYQELRQQLGDEVFFDFLQSFHQRYRYGFATAADFQSAAESSCRCQLDDLFDLWVYQGGPLAAP